jgi:hypothetical protein
MYFLPGEAVQREKIWFGRTTTAFECWFTKDKRNCRPGLYCNENVLIVWYTINVNLCLKTENASQARQKLFCMHSIRHETKCETSKKTYMHSNAHLFQQKKVTCGIRDLLSINYGSQIDNKTEWGIMFFGYV